MSEPSNTDLRVSPFQFFERHIEACWVGTEAQKAELLAALAQRDQSPASEQTKSAEEWMGKGISARDFTLSEIRRVQSAARAQGWREGEQMEAALRTICKAFEEWSKNADVCPSCELIEACGDAVDLLERIDASPVPLQRREREGGTMTVLEAVREAGGPTTDRHIAEVVGLPLWRTQGMLNALARSGKILKLSERYARPGIYQALLQRDAKEAKG